MRDIRPQKPLALLIRMTPSIDGFSYPLLRLLVDRLEDLMTEDKLFKEGGAKARGDSDEGRGSRLTEVGSMVVEALSDSMGIQINASYSAIEKFLESANSFLSTFEV